MVSGRAWSKLKFYWWALLFGVGILTFFGLAAPTKDWTSAMEWLRSADQFILTHARYPGLFALVLGLLLGSAILPEMWRALRRHLPRGPEFDIKAVLFWSYSCPSRTVVEHSFDVIWVNMLVTSHEYWRRAERWEAQLQISTGATGFSDLTPKSYYSLTAPTMFYPMGSNTFFSTS